MSTPFRPFHAVVVGAIVGGFGTPAPGQNALGDGRALDRPLRLGDQVNNPVRDFEAELRFRNAIVTGNAPGGLGFRGNVDHVAPGEFFGALGSDDTFAFRRDSLYSGLGGLGIRGTEALQLQAALSTGRVPSTPFGTASLPLYRTGYSARGRQFDNPAVASDPSGISGARFPTQRQLDPNDPAFDDRGMSLWTIRSPSAFVATQSFRPSLLGMSRDESGQTRAMEASPLRGIQSFPYSPDGGAEADDAPESDRSGRVQPDPTSRPLDLSVRPNERDLAARPGEGEAEEEGAEARAGADPHSYEGLLDRLQLFMPETGEEEGEGEAPGRAGQEAEAGRGGVHEIPDWRARLLELRSHLMPGLEEDPLADTLLRTDEEEEEAEGSEEGKKREDRKPLLDEETLAMLRESAGRIAELAPAGTDDIYARHMRRGEELLAKGRYFDAEARFARAIGIRPDDAMASVGRVHAQLGAGLFLSAGLNLRSLLISHPELVATRFEAGLLPSADRLKTVVGLLREEVAEGQRLGDSAGLLLAWVGYQMGEMEVVSEGLDMLPLEEELAVDASPERVRVARLADLLRAVWFPDDETDDAD